MREKLPIDWDRVFDLRCKIKRGEGLSREEWVYCAKAFRADPERYAKLGQQVVGNVEK